MLLKLKAWLKNKLYRTIEVGVNLEALTGTLKKYTVICTYKLPKAQLRVNRITGSARLLGYDYPEKVLKELSELYPECQFQLEVGVETDRNLWGRFSKGWCGNTDGIKLREFRTTPNSLENAIEQGVVNKNQMLQTLTRSTVSDINEDIFKVPSTGYYGPKVKDKEQ